MANDRITTGVKITVDASELDVKFLKSVDELNAGLTKTQQSLKLTYNEEGLLTNALGQCVESLSTSQIKLGQYVDELGRVHTIQGGFTEGLNKSQIAMGQYADEFGNIYNKIGKLIGQTEKAAKALEKQAREAARATAQAKEAAQSLQSMGKTGAQVANSISGIADSFLGSSNSISRAI